MRLAAFRRLWAAKDLRNRLLITVGILVLYRLCANIPAPGVDRDVLAQVIEGGTFQGGALGVFDLLAGGTVSNFSVLAMGVYPYITAQIILQLLVPIIPALKTRMEEDPREGRQMMEKWTLYLAIPMSFLNAIGQIQIFRFSNAAILPNFGFGGGDLVPTLGTLIAMTAGSMFAIWLGELISEHGIRNQGLSLIIFSGIVASLPTSIGQLWFDENLRIPALIVFVLLLVITVLAIVFITQGRRNIPVMYPGRRMGYRQSMPVRGTLPLLVNMAGMIPIIFATAIMSFPALAASFFINSSTPWVQNAASSVTTVFSTQPPTWFYVAVLFLMVAGFTFFYTDVLFQQQNYGENLKRQGAQVPGVAKGFKTQQYLSKVLRRVTLPGALMLGVVAILPFLVGLLWSALGTSGAFNAFFFIGSGLLIVVGVVREIFFGLETELKLRGYDDTLLVK